MRRFLLAFAALSLASAAWGDGLTYPPGATSGGTFNSPTFTGTVTMPDGSTWTSSGLTSSHAAAITGIWTFNAGSIVLGTAVNGDIGTFNSSHALIDSGTLLTSLAPLVSPSFTTPTLGAATATTINKVTITAPATGSTLTIPDGVTLNAGAGGTLGSNAFTSTAFAPLASPTFTGTTTEPDGTTYDSTGPKIHGCVTQGQVFYVNSSGYTVCLGTGTSGAQLTTKGAGAIPAWTTPATYQGALVGFTPNSNSVATMGGLAGTITPTTNGEVQVCYSGYWTNSAVTAAEGIINLQISYGTGTAPTTNAALTGTQAGGLQKSLLSATATAAADIAQPLNDCVVITGLTVGTAYWLDIAAEAAVNVSNITHGAISASEL